MLDRFEIQMKKQEIEIKISIQFKHLLMFAILEIALQLMLR